MRLVRKKILLCEGIRGVHYFFDAGYVNFSVQVWEDGFHFISSPWGDYSDAFGKQRSLKNGLKVVSKNLEELAPIWSKYEKGQT